MTPSTEGQPLSSPMLALRVDRSLIRAAAHSRRFLLASVTAPEAPRRTDRQPVNVALVLDRSGSMSGSRKFELARQAVEHALAMLRPEDRFSLVVYDSEVDVLTPSTHATAEAKRVALQSLREVGPRGCTDLCGGWLRGCEQLAEHLAKDVVSRVLLLTDGLANQGITDHATMAHHASELRQRGVVTSTFGVGEDFDERLLRDMAHEGGGNFYFIEAPAQIPDLLTSELGEALEVVMRRAVLHVQLPDDTDARPLNRYRHTRAAGDNELRVELGDLVSAQEIHAVIELRFPTGDVGRSTAVRVALGSDDSLHTSAEGVVEFTYASHGENDRQPRDRVVDREVARLYAALARAEATEANRHGDFTSARRVLDRTMRRVMGYAGSDAELRGIVAELRAEMPRYDVALDAMSLKQAVFASELASKSRNADGRARRRR